MTAFYFRASGEVRESSKNFDKTFEFTHKSFGEYLTAQRILRELKNIYSELQRNEEDSDQGCDEKEALTRWAKLCGAAPMDQYIFRFVCDEMKLQVKENVEQWQKMLCRLMEVMLRDGLPMEELAPRLNFKEEMRQARNAEESLLAALNACARVTEKISEIHWQDTTTFGTWLKRIQGQRMDWSNVLAMDCLSWLNLNHCDLRISDLYRVNLAKANLVGANFVWANLLGANLAGANLARAILREAILTEANLEEANLERAILTEANLARTILREAILTEANLEEADLVGADLEKADLVGANLIGAILEGANLGWADLEGAILEGANLEGAILVGVDLVGANVKNTILDQSNSET